MMRVLSTLAVALAVSAPALAQTAAEPSAAAIASATAMIEAISPQAREQASLETQLANIRRGALVLRQIRNNVRVQKAATDNKVALEAMLARAGALQADALAPIFRQRADAIREATIRSYATRFTITALNAVTAFYKSGPGAKLLSSQPGIAAQVNRDVNARFAPNVKAAQDTVAPQVADEVKKMFPDQAPS
jgi:hypothetical protein